VISLDAVKVKCKMASAVPAQSFRDLVVWQRSIQLATAIYRLTSGFPKEEMYGLTSQFDARQFQYQATSQKGREDD